MKLYLLATFALALLKLVTGAITDGEYLLRIIQRSFTSTPTEGVNVTTTEPTFSLLTNNSTEMPDMLSRTTPPPPTEPTTTRRPLRNITFPVNVTFKSENISYHSDILRHDVPRDRRLEYFNALSDSMRQENKFQDDSYLTAFADLFYWVLTESKNLPASIKWSKKLERKHLKRLLKYALNSEALNPDQESKNTGCFGDQPYVPYKWLSKSFYESLIAHTEIEGYEILMETIEHRNQTLSIEQTKAIQCLYYSSFSGMQHGRAYIFNIFDEEWDLRNSLFSRPLILDSLRSMVAELAGLSAAGKTPKVSKFMEEIFTVFSEYKTRLDQEAKSRPRQSPQYFHNVASKLEGHLMGMVKWDNFIDFDSKDIMMGAGMEVVLDATGETFDPDKTPILFDALNRQSWYYLQLLRPAGSQVFEKYQDFLSVMVTEKITTAYKAGRQFRRRFSAAFLHIRQLPTGPLILTGCETLNKLMAEAGTKHKDGDLTKLENFQQTLLFLRGLYSTDEDVLSNLPQQIQFLTNPVLNQNLKLMIKYSSGGEAATGSQFAEVGVKFQENGPQLTFRPFPFISDINATEEDELFKNEWTFQLGYFRGFSEALFAPVIKANIFLTDDFAGRLTFTWRTTTGMIYEIGGDHQDHGFWDLKLLSHHQSFQLIHHGRLEHFFSVVQNTEGFPVGLQATHFIPDDVPNDFAPAEFIVIPVTNDFM